MDPAALRIIDANANRAREALRVMEDAARFALDDQALCAALKSLRHDLAAAIAPLERLGMIVHRDTPGDVGTGVSTPTEMDRACIGDVAVAAGKRLTEALRSIEEFAKTDATVGSAPGVETLRYRAYTLEQRLVLALAGRRSGFSGWRLCVLITESLCRSHSWLEVARAAIEGGADCLQLREKELPDREFLARARSLAALAHPKRVAVVINDRVDIALLAGADAVHLGQQDLTVAEARRLAGFRLRIGVSTANIDQARAAMRDGADYCGVGPMYSSSTKEKPSLSGPEYLREYLAHDPPLPPALAISGIGPDSIDALRRAAGDRVFGVAVSSCVCGAPDPGAVCADLRERMASDACPAPRTLTATPSRGTIACPSNSSTPPSRTA